MLLKYNGGQIMARTIGFLEKRLGNQEMQCLYKTIRSRFLASSCDASTKDDSDWDVSFASIIPGSRLEFDSEGRAVDIRFGTTLQDDLKFRTCKNDVMTKTNDSKFVTSAPILNLRKEVFRNDKSPKSYKVFPAGASSMFTEGIEIEGVIPAQGMNALIKTCGGNVRFSEFKESEILQMQTSGGNVLGKSIQAENAEIDAGGGYVDLKSLTATTARLRNVSCLSIKRLTGCNVILRSISEKDKIQLGGCHVENLDAECFDFTAKTLRCIKSGEIVLKPEGRLDIGGFDGNLKVKLSHGTHVSILLTEAARTLEIECMDRVPNSASINEIYLYVAPNLKVEADIMQDFTRNMTISTESHNYSISKTEASDHVILNPIEIPEKNDGTNMRHLPLSTEDLCHVKINSRDSCNIHIQSKSWRQLVQARQN